MTHLHFFKLRWEAHLVTYRVVPQAFAISSVFAPFFLFLWLISAIPTFPRPLPYLISGREHPPRPKRAKGTSNLDVRRGALMKLSHLGRKLFNWVICGNLAAVKCQPHSVYSHRWNIWTLSCLLTHVHSCSWCWQEPVGCRFAGCVFMGSNVREQQDNFSSAMVCQYYPDILTPNLRIRQKLFLIRFFIIITILVFF